MITLHYDHSNHIVVCLFFIFHFCDSCLPVIWTLSSKPKQYEVFCFFFHMKGKKRTEFFILVYIQMQTIYIWSRRTRKIAQIGDRLLFLQSHLKSLCLLKNIDWIDLGSWIFRCFEEQCLKAKNSAAVPLAGKAKNCSRQERL